MKVVALRTSIVEPRSDCTLSSFLDEHLPTISEGSILAVTSKIVSLFEKRVVKVGDREKDELIYEEADVYIPAALNPYGIALTIKNNLLVPNAGIDESNAHGHYVLWPENAQKSANEIRRYLRARFHLEKVGVVITDSTTSPLKRGTLGVAIAHSGFLALKNYIGKPDIFGRPLRVTQANLRDALAAAAVAVMGEGNEQTPLALIEDVPFIEFQTHDPNAEEFQELRIAMDKDLYAPLLKNVPWEAGRGEEDVVKL